MAHILVVDDEEGVREFIADALALDGHTVTTAADGEAALACLGRQAFEVLITDLRMPRLDGMELVRRARADVPETEIVVLTAHGTVETAVEAMKLGAFEYLRKPIQSLLELRLLVGRALERRRLRDAHEQRGSSDRSELTLGYGDPAMAPVEAALRKVAATPATVLLLGESGSGKEVAAQAIHRLSPRASGPFVAVNCAAISDNLLESELFGHERGAFTGATQTRRGRLELAAGGTFFLDEIAEMKPELQAKLLRVLEVRSFERVGGSRTFAADVRWIAATHRDLPAMIRAGTFREDLYHRLAVFPIRLPPLRERRRDILPLAATLLARSARQLGRPGLELTREAAALIVAADWPGNVRELGNALERAAILADGTRIEPHHLLLPGSAVSPAASGGSTLADLERDAIKSAVAAVAGSRQRAADRLGISVRTLYDKLKRYGLEAD
jgi:two-component system response regulator FlrC